MSEQCLGWFKSLLETLETTLPASLLTIHLFLTEKMSTDDIFHLTYQDTMTCQDPITQLQSKSVYGRPRWDKLFQEIVTQTRTDTCPKRMGVFYCGSQKAGKEIREQCRLQSNDVIRFDFRREHF